jgi:hypothetical protein
MEWLLGALGGLIGGNAAGAKSGLGVAGNSIAGALGGGATGAVIQAMTGSGMDIGQIAGQLGGGGVVGGILAAVVGMITKRRGTPGV